MAAMTAVEHAIRLPVKGGPNEITLRSLSALAKALPGELSPRSFPVLARIVGKIYDYDMAMASRPPKILFTEILPRILTGAGHPELWEPLGAFLENPDLIDDKEAYRALIVSERLLDRLQNQALQFPQEFSLARDKVNAHAQRDLEDRQLILQMPLKTIIKILEGKCLAEEQTILPERLKDWFSWAGAIRLNAINVIKNISVGSIGKGKPIAKDKHKTICETMREFIQLRGRAYHLLPV